MNMAGGRRNISRSIPSRFVIPEMRYKSSVSDQKARLASFQHVVFPDIPREGDISFEALMILFVFVSLSLQYLNLYRTIWWLPRSHALYAMNTYLIDLDVAGFVLVLLCRRFIWSLLRVIALDFMPRKIAQDICIIFRWLLLSTIVSSLIWFTYRIFLKHHIFRILYLYYMIFMYFILFGATADPFLSLNPVYTKCHFSTSAAPCYIYHVCSLNPEFVRQEVHYLRTDFNMRVKQVLYNAMQLGYYTGMIPILFAQGHLYYDSNWVMLHALFSFLTGASLYASYCLPPVYSDTLHRASIHLGSWCWLDDHHAHVPCSAWTRDQVWSHGVLIKHCRKYYKCDSYTAAAEPGNSSHQRFYFWFQNPVVLHSLLLAMQCMAVLCEVIYLGMCSEWYKLITGFIMIFINVYSLFKIFRDCLIVFKIYQVEQVILGHQRLPG